MFRRNLCTAQTWHFFAAFTEPNRPTAQWTYYLKRTRKQWTFRISLSLSLSFSLTCIYAVAYSLTRVSGSRRGEKEKENKLLLGSFHSVICSSNQTTYQRVSRLCHGPPLNLWALSSWQGTEGKSERTSKVPHNFSDSQSSLTFSFFFPSQNINRKALENQSQKS